MLPTDSKAIAQVARVAPAYGAADPRQQAFQRALAPQLGKALHGEVLARLTDGSFVVKVANIPARIHLPAGVQVGADVPLTLVSVHPRPAFQVSSGAISFLSEAAAPPAQGADPSKTPLSMREAPTAQASTAAARATGLLQAALAGSAVFSAGTEASNTTLSQAGKTIGGVLAAAETAATRMTSLVGQTPLVAAAGADAASIAAALQHAVGKSGLFYESHVAEWAQGARSLVDLEAEPQQQLAREGVRQLPLDPATAQFINMQLSTQEQAQFAWQGNAWPGQAMQLEVQRDAPKAEDDASAAATPWHSRLRLHFPELGELDARLTLTGGRLRIQVAVGSDASAGLLRQNITRLACALGAAGTELAGFDIEPVKPGPVSSNDRG